MNGAIHLESPFPSYAIPRVFLWMRQNWDKVADDSTPQEVIGFVERWLRAERNGQKSWAVLKNSEIGGAILSTRISPTAADLHCIFRREFWGRGNTVPALTLACEEIFRDVDKITSLVYPNNRALIGIAMANGATKEGHLRRHVRKGGELVDMLLLGLTKEAFYACRGDRRLQQPEWQQPILEQQQQQRERVGHVHYDEEPHALPAGAPAQPLLNHPAVHDQSASGRSAIGAGGA